MAATLELTRHAFGVELRRGTFDVYVDRQRAGSIEWQGRLEMPIEPGHHVLQVRKGRYSSRAVAFDATDGTVVHLRCHGARIWPIWLATFAVPSRALSLVLE